MKISAMLGIFLMVMIGRYTVQSVDIFSDQYVGCYEKHSGGGFDHVQEPWPTTDNSINNCVDYCKSKGYAYAGMQRGEICQCGNNYFGTLSLNCWNRNRVKCPGNQSEVCGGTRILLPSQGASTFRVCPAGRFGSSCSDVCSESCAGKGCDFDGNCLNECPAGRYGTDCILSCLTGKFGANCKELCQNCLNDRCHPVNGYCTDGCKTDLKRHGPFCQTYYDAGDNNPTGPCPFCGHCKNSICVGGTGTAYYECPDTWQGDKCAECDDGRYGTRCENSCSNCASGKCLHEEGLCIGVGCNEGFYGSKCSDICPANCQYDRCVQIGGMCSSAGCKDSFHGSKCGEACPQNCKSSTCYQEGGNCIYGCNDGYYGLQCNESCPANCALKKCSQDGDTCTLGCPDGFHGPTCSELCPVNCKSGRCSGDGGMCTRGCLGGFFGDFCDMTCSVYCATDSCTQEDGSCTDGCQAGFYGPLCQQVCPPRTFGSSCLECHCEGAVKCDVVSGACPGACEDGWSGDNCQVADEQADEQGDGINVTAVVGIAAAVIVVLTSLAVIVFLVVYCRRSRSSPSTPQPPSSMHLSQVRVAGDLASSAETGGKMGTEQNVGTGDNGDDMSSGFKGAENDAVYEMIDPPPPAEPKPYANLNFQEQ